MRRSRSPPEQVERVVDETILFTRCEFGLELGEIGAALMNDHHFTVEDRLTGDIQRACDHGKPLRPVQPVAGEHPLLPLVEMDLDPVTVELDFMEPPVAGRRLGLQRGQLRFDESRHFRRGGRRDNSPRTLGHRSTQKASLTSKP